MLGHRESQRGASPWAAMQHRSHHTVNPREARVEVGAAFHAPTAVMALLGVSSRRRSSPPISLEQVPREGGHQEPSEFTIHSREENLGGSASRQPLKRMASACRSPPGNDW